MNVSTTEVWDDVEGAAFGDGYQDDCVKLNDAFEVQSPTEMFEAEFDDSVSTVMNFNKNVKFVLMTVHTMF
jgi:hypothetical protein